MNKSTFKLAPIDNNIFMIVKQDATQGLFYRSLPIEAYGFIRINKFDDENFGVSTMNIAEEVYSSRELSDLEKEAINIVKREVE